MSEEGRVKPPYGGFTQCAAADCRRVLDETHGVFMHRNRASGKFVMLCGTCSRDAQMYDSLKLPLVAL